MDETGPQNAVTGDSFTTDLPETGAPLDELAVEKNMAKFSKTKEYKKLKEYLEARIKFFEAYLPDGKEVRWEADPEIGLKWIIANNIINEFKAVLNSYENAKEAVKNESAGT